MNTTIKNLAKARQTAQVALEERESAAATLRRRMAEENTKKQKLEAQKAEAVTAKENALSGVAQDKPGALAVLNKARLKVKAIDESLANLDELIAAMDNRLDSEFRTDETQAIRDNARSADQLFWRGVFDHLANELRDKVGADLDEIKTSYRLGGLDGDPDWFFKRVFVEGWGPNKAVSTNIEKNPDCVAGLEKRFLS